MRAHNIPTGQPGLDVLVGPRRLSGILGVPAEARSLVLFVHGSATSRLSPRNQRLADLLQKAGIATLLFDLLNQDEGDDRKKVFDIELLAERLEEATDWVRRRPETCRLRLGYLGASTGAAAAVVVAARQPDIIGAVVSRGGRPDLAEAHLVHVVAPTLLIVGGEDDLVIRLNEQVLSRLDCPKQLVVIPGATHLFPEPGALEQVAGHAGEWFQRHLPEGAAAQDASDRPPGR